MSNWHTTNQTLSSTALLAILRECVDRGLGVGTECRESVEAGADSFSNLPATARSEFVLLHQESCPPDVSEDACIEQIQANRDFRALPRGRLDPSPLKMNQGIRTLFTVAIRSEGQISGRSGLATDIAFETREGQNGVRRIEAIPYTSRMCFSLAAEDPKSATIEPQQRPETEVRPDGRICMKMNQGGSDLKYSPSWWVTPRSGNDLNLYFDTEYYRGSEKRQFQNEPRPIVVDVIPKQGWWDAFDNFLKRATGTANLATEFAVALGALFAAISAWAIWSFFRRRRAGDAASQDPSAAPVAGPADSPPGDNTYS